MRRDRAQKVLAVAVTKAVAVRVIDLGRLTGARTLARAERRQCGGGYNCPVYPCLCHSIISMDPIKINAESNSSRFERILAQTQFEALSPLLERLSAERERLLKLVLEAHTYAELLSGLGLKLTI